MPRSSVHYSNESIRQARTALKGSGALLEVLDDIETHLTQYQRQAIHEAHLHGEAKDGRYTIAELARKTRILRRAGFNQIQREALLRGGVAGYNSRPIELRYGLAELELDLEYRREDRLREAEIALAREVANRPAAEAIRNAREWKESYRQWQQRGEQAARNLETAASEQRRAGVRRERPWECRRGALRVSFRARPPSLHRDHVTAARHVHVPGRGRGALIRTPRLRIRKRRS